MEALDAASLATLLTYRHSPSSYQLHLVDKAEHNSIISSIDRGGETEEHPRMG